jgi:hypothetical protein
MRTPLKSHVDRDVCVGPPLEAPGRRGGEGTERAGETPYAKLRQRHCEATAYVKYY